MWDAVLRGDRWRGEVINRRKDGSVYDADLTAAPILSNEGEIIGLIGSHRDMTRIKEVERLKSQFVSNVTHELRTPLTNIRLYQRYLREGRRPDLQERFFEILDRETTRLMRMIESLLDLSRLETGIRPFESEILDLNELAGKVVDDYSAQANERGIALDFVPSGASALTKAGRDQITQALTNLLSNALNYTPQGGSIRVATGISGHMVTVSIRDTGYGIPPEEMQQVFERFFRGEAARKSGAPGTGLGLAIVKQILEMHSGTIHIDSQPGEETTVTVALPATEEAAFPGHVLLVEDDPDISFLIQHQLEGQGYRVTPARNGEAALKQITQEMPDLMVLDLLLPRMDGFQVLEQLQTGEYGPIPPVLVITGADAAMAGQAMTLGASEFLSKPYSPQVFMDVVARLMQKRAQS
jgi:signal transduction histidine kinase/ActR/RegA family two-component response regulator